MRQPYLKALSGQRIHMVGIGGSSMSGLAEMLAADGHILSGTDSADSYQISRLRGKGLDVRVGHHPDMVKGAGLLVYSAAISPQDPERLEAGRLGVPQMERAALLGEMMRAFPVPVCISGTHGKTTTSAMLAQMLADAGLDPSVHLGGSLDAIGGSVRKGDSGIFVAEACEFNRSFLHMPVSVALLLNIEEDHLDCYGDMEHVEEAFLQFLSRLPDDGTAIVNWEDERVRRVVGKLEKKRRRVLTFGNGEGFDYSFGRITYNARGCAAFDALTGGSTLCEVRLQVPGLYNALHALAALAGAHVLQADMEKAALSLGRYAGAHRRFEHTGIVKGMELYHDYGHNPAEMRAAIGMAKLQDRRVIAVMQPHTYSRVKTLFRDYLTCTTEADITLVTDIFAARETDPGDINSTMLVDGMRAHGIEAYLAPGFTDAEAWLLENGRAGDLVLTMGCGNINLLNIQMQRHFDHSPGHT